MKDIAISCKDGELQNAHSFTLFHSLDFNLTIESRFHQALN